MIAHIHVSCLIKDDAVGREKLSSGVSLGPHDTEQVGGDLVVHPDTATPLIHDRHPISV
jgi:hypothetical protein